MFDPEPAPPHPFPIAAVTSGALQGWVGDGRDVIGASTPQAFKRSLDPRIFVLIPSTRSDGAFPRGLVALEFLVVPGAAVPLALIRAILI